jgi:hypothetical protein
MAPFGVPFSFLALRGKFAPVLMRENRGVR